MHFRQVFVYFRIWGLGWPKMAARCQKEAVRRLTRTREGERERERERKRERERNREIEKLRNRATTTQRNRERENELRVRSSGLRAKSWELRVES